MTIFRAAWVVARRDFISLVATPTFLFFLLAPLMMIGFGLIGGGSAGQLAQSAGKKEHIVAIVPVAERAAFAAVDARLRVLGGRRDDAPRLILLSDDSDHRAAIAAYRGDTDMLAILTGNAAAPQIAARNPDGFASRYLANLAETVRREGLDRAADARAASTPSFSTIASGGTSSAARTAMAYGAVFGIFLLMLLLAGQTVGMLAEEKGNKVIEILAAAIPLEGVFFGKLIGMIGIAIVFIAFWATLGLIGLTVFTNGNPAQALAGMTASPAVGWPLFALLIVTYFLFSFLLLGGMFLGVGAQASTVREIQMLSLPVTFLQVGMFALASNAANNPGSTTATVAQWIPWSSPMAMAARAASDASLWPHVVALGWQALWIAITIAVSVRLFRAGVLRSGGGFSLFRRARPVAVDS